MVNVESVAEHSWGVALTTMILAEGIQQELDVKKALTIALLHDLPESVLSDIPSPGARYLPEGAKRSAEESALAELLDGLPDAAQLRKWWAEFEDGSSLEGQLVRDADRLEMLLQADLYEESRGCHLDEFWDNQETGGFYLPISQAVYSALVKVRAQRFGDEV
jgi:putative hydrolase of HD superfamily